MYDIGWDLMSFFMLCAGVCQCVCGRHRVCDACLVASGGALGQFILCMCVFVVYVD